RSPRNVLPPFLPEAYRNPIQPHSSPTRRSSDLTPASTARMPATMRRMVFLDMSASDQSPGGRTTRGADEPSGRRPTHRVQQEAETGRAHAELQSREKRVCRLLLEKKKPNCRA